MSELTHNEQDVENIEGVTEIRISAQEFESKMKELLPGASGKAIATLINYAEDLHKDGTHPMGAFFSASYVAYNLVTRRYGVDTASRVLKICEESCFNPWEILDAARLVDAGVPSAEIIRKAIDGELDLLPKHYDEIKAGLATLKNSTLDIPATDDEGGNENV